MYKLPSPFALTDKPPEKRRWKETVKTKIQKYWQQKIKEDAGKKSSMKFLNLEACMPDMVHPVWRCGTDPLQVTIAVTKARLLIKRYPLGSSHSAGTHK